MHVTFALPPHVLKMVFIFTVIIVADHIRYHGFGMGSDWQLLLLSGKYGG